MCQCVSSCLSVCVSLSVCPKPEENYLIRTLKVIGFWWYLTLALTCLVFPRPTQSCIPLGLVNVDYRGSLSSAGKKKAGMVHSVSRWTQGVQLKLWNTLRTRAIRRRGVFTMRCYTNPCMLFNPAIEVWFGFITWCYQLLLIVVHCESFNDLFNIFNNRSFLVTSNFNDCDPILCISSLAGWANAII